VDGLAGVVSASSPFRAVDVGGRTRTSRTGPVWPDGLRPFCQRPAITLLPEPSIFLAVWLVLRWLQARFGTPVGTAVAEHLFALVVSQPAFPVPVLVPRVDNRHCSLTAPTAEHHGHCLPSPHTTAVPPDRSERRRHAIPFAGCQPAYGGRWRFRPYATLPLLPAFTWPPAELLLCRCCAGGALNTGASAARTPRRCMCRATCRTLPFGRRADCTA